MYYMLTLSQLRSHGSLSSADGEDVGPWDLVNFNLAWNCGPWEFLFLKARSTTECYSELILCLDYFPI